MGRVKALEKTWFSGMYENCKKHKAEHIMAGGSVCGYRVVTLQRDGIQHTPRVHRIVATHFISNPLGKDQVNHKNGIKADNRVENLEWCNASENQLHAFAIGLSTPKRGIKHYMAKLSEDDVRTIRAMWESGAFLQREISEQYSIDRGYVAVLLGGKTWKHLN